MKMSSPLKKAIPLYQQAYEEIKAAILSGRIKPGEKLSEAYFAKELQISRTPIREAFRQLQTEGLLVIDNYNSFVIEISLQDFEELSECRLFLEKEAIRKAIFCITDNEIERLEKSVFDSQEALKKGEHLKALECFSEFHEILDCAAPNQRLTQMLTQVRSFLLLYRARTLDYSMLNHVIIEEHELILNAVKQRNLDLAILAVDTHVKGDIARTREIFNHML